MPARLTALLILALAAAASLLPRGPAAAGQPVITLMLPKDGAVLEEPPPVIHICFAEPINILDLGQGGDFRFRVERPDGHGVGLRIVFQYDGFGADVYPGIHDEKLAGEWTMEWRVTDAETLEPLEGVVSYTVSPGGTPVLEEPASRCPASTPTAAGSPTGAAGSGSEDDDGGPDTLLLASLIVGITVGVASIVLAAYLFQRRRHRAD